jgi:hypothetical protein
MYRNCIFCSADFGRNEAVETFTVGRQLAFDSWRGRLWAVCQSCARWNLAPIEERWEAVEQAEKLFRDARLRIQSENVGLASLADGTRLVRVGAAIPGELAAWRYGTQLLRRRRHYLIVTGGAVAGAAALYSGLAAAGVSAWAAILATRAFNRRRAQRVLHRVPPAQDPSGVGAVIRHWHLAGMDLHSEMAGFGLQVRVRNAHLTRPPRQSRDALRSSDGMLVIRGDHARALLGRAMVLVNRKGATATSLREANRILDDAGSADRVLREAALGGAALGEHAGVSPELLRGPGALAVEMALNEQSERRALEGELAALEAAWREAEEIAAIADRLPGEAMVDRLLHRIAGP